MFESDISGTNSALVSSSSSSSNASTPNFYDMTPEQFGQFIVEKYLKPRFDGLAVEVQQLRENVGRITTENEQLRQQLTNTQSNMQVMSQQVALGTKRKETDDTGREEGPAKISSSSVDANRHPEEAAKPSLLDGFHLINSNNRAEIEGERRNFVQGCANTLIRLLPGDPQGYELLWYCNPSKETAIKCVELEPTNAKYWLNVARSHLSNDTISIPNFGNFNKMGILLKALEFNQNLNKIVTSSIMLEVGLLLKLSEQVTINRQAFTKLQCYFEALKENPSNADVYFQLGQSLTATDFIINGTRVLDKNFAYKMASKLKPATYGHLSNSSNLAPDFNQNEVNQLQQVFSLIQLIENGANCANVFNMMAKIFCQLTKGDLYSGVMINQKYYSTKHLLVLALKEEASDGLSSEELYTQLANRLVKGETIQLKPNSQVFHLEYCLFEITQLNPNSHAAWANFGSVLAPNESYERNGFKWTRESCYKNAAHHHPLSASFPNHSKNSTEDFYNFLKAQAYRMSNHNGVPQPSLQPQVSPYPQINQTAQNALLLIQQAFANLPQSAELQSKYSEVLQIIAKQAPSQSVQQVAQPQFQPQPCAQSQPYSRLASQQPQQMNDMQPQQSGSFSSNSDPAGISPTSSHPAPRFNQAASTSSSTSIATNQPVLTTTSATSTTTTTTTTGSSVPANP